MIIERIQDKKFIITITEKEALRFANGSEVDFETSKSISKHIGTLLLHYIIEASMFPHDNRPALEVEL